MRVRLCADTARSALLIALAVPQVVISTSVTGSSALFPTIASPSSCPSRTINYITQTLPQQCLTSSWASKPVAHSAATLDVLNSIDVLANVLAPNTSQPTSLERTQSKTATTASPSSDTGTASESSTHRTTQLSPNTETSREVDQAGESSQEIESESPLDRANFLSFEEWKHQNLANAGQSVENLGSRDGGGRREHARKLGGINNALESLGEDSEIDIDFSGFGNVGSINDALPAQAALSQEPTAQEEDVTEDKTEDPSSPHHRQKDAGKTCKERSNYASFDCAATALKANPECKGATSVLVESKDSYMLNVCSAKNKFLIVELCDDILIDTIVLANFEYFSSMFRTFRVSVSDRYPVKLDKWKELGTFEARNSRGIQAFLVENPLIWARYLRIEFLTHFGAEYYCPVSLLRVHGTTMMEEFNHEVKGARGEEEIELEGGGGDEEATIQTPEIDSADVLKTELQTVSEHSKEEESVPPNERSTGNAPSVAPETPSMEEERRGSSTVDFTPNRLSIGKALEDLLSCRGDRTERCSYVRHIEEATHASEISPSTAYEPKTSAMANYVPSVKPDVEVAFQEVKPSLEQTGLSISPSHQSSSTHPTLPVNNDDGNTHSTYSTKTASSSSAISSVKSALISASTSSIKYPVTANSTSLALSTTGAQSPSSTHSIKPPPSLTQSPAANPSTQESFFKSVHKRLQQLEANSTLSLQYIEEQSRILRDAFSKVEKRQLSKTSTFLDVLNTTVMTELRDFRMQYDQIWQSTVLELSSQREQSAREVSVLSARMAFLADEIVFQKRMAMVQFMLILLCLGLIVFSRYGGASTYLELPPLVQSAINKSSANLARYKHFETPPMSPSSTRPPSTGTSSKYGLFRRRNHAHSPSDESDVNSRAKSPTIEYRPPTPSSQESRQDRNHSPSGPSGDESDTLGFGYTLSDHHILRATGSSPATPNGVREKDREHF